MNPFKKLTQGDNIYFFRMFKFMKPSMVRYIITQLIYASQGFAFPFFLATFASNIMYAVQAGDRDLVVSAGLIFLVMMGIYILVFCVAVYINGIAIERATLDMKLQLFGKFVRTGIEDARHSGEGIATINADADTAVNVFESPLMMLLYNLIVIPASLVVFFIINPFIGLVLLGVGVLSFIAQIRFTKPLAEIGKKRLDVNADAVKSVSNIFSGAVTIRAYNMQPQAILTFDKENKQLRLLDIRQGIISVWQRVIGTAEGWLSLITVFGLGGWFVATSRLDFHYLMTVYILGMTFTKAIGDLGQVYANMQPPIAGAKRVFAILDKKETITGRPLESKEADSFELSVNNLSFKYMDAEEETLKNIRLNIQEKKMVAFVGESGSGKSTLLKILIGMYDRDGLDMSLGTLGFNESTLQNWRKNFAYVDQSCKLFDMSIKENIAMGLGGAASEDEIKEAAKRAAISDFIESLDEGYDTSCGEKGAMMSGGQKQRLAIARALVKKAGILVFDEATSSLDSESENQIMETIESLRSDHTILITTHKLENIRTADLIVVLDNGVISATGTHDELIKNNDIYRTLTNGAA